MKIFIIGASGLIGRTLFFTLSKKFRVFGTYNLNKTNKRFIKFDITKDNIDKLCAKINEDDIFIILSAYTNPTWISKNKTKSKKTNLLGTKKLIDQIISYKSKIVFMSSVEVFNGKKNFFTEKDKPNPLNFYGKAKYEIEKYIIKRSKNYLIFRTSWNSDDVIHGRCVIELTYQTIKKGNAKMAKDNFFSITHVRDTCKIMKKHIFLKNKILHVSNNRKISRSILARKINDIVKKKMFYKVVNFSEIKFTEPRAKNSLLKSLDDYIKNFNFKNTDNLIKRKIKLIEKI
jgi:dTDP-4-dehydrorhamnose reductase